MKQQNTKYWNHRSFPQHNQQEFKRLISSPSPVAAEEVSSDTTFLSSSGLYEYQNMRGSLNGGCATK